MNALRVVVGLGKTGLSCVRHLRAQGYPVVVTDNRSVPPGLHALRENFPDVPLYLDHYPASILASAKELVVSPGVSLSEPVIAQQIADGIPAVGDIELFARATNVPVIAITGSNGKSTVTTLLGEMLKAAGLRAKIGGNLGTPALALLAEEEKDGAPDCYVLELSSFQLERTFSLSAKAAVVLNITPDHLDRYACFEDYVAVKKSVYARCRAPVINRDDPRSFEAVTFDNAPVSMGLGEPAEGAWGLRSVDGVECLAYGDQMLLPTRDIKLRGRHHLINVLAALALGQAVGARVPFMLEALKTFAGLAHRCEWIRTRRGVDWYNDSKATNVGATEAALEGLGADMTGKLVLIAGGVGKGADFSSLHAPVSRHVRTVILLGNDAKRLGVALKGAAKQLYVHSLEEAVALAVDEAESGDAVILAPACASFDMYENFSARGRAFTHLVRGLAE